jgi:hypothetical protein
MSHTTPNCDECGYVKIIPENLEVMHLIEKYFMFFFDGMGNPSLQSIMLALEYEDMIDRRDIFDKIIFYLIEAIQVREEQRSKK